MSGHSSTAPETIFYDSHCALCHGLVQFVVHRDRGEDFHFAPLGGERFRSLVREADRPGLPDSVVVLDSKGRLLVRSQATLHVLRRLGGRWRLLAALATPLPRAFLDVLYDFIARVRYRVFGTRSETCPALPPKWRKRFHP